MSGRYAVDTRVSVERSKVELERIFDRWGASSFAYAKEAGRIAIGFKVGRTSFRLLLPMPSLDDKQIQFTATGKRRSAPQAETAWAQERRRRWRALILVVKAKLEAVESGITTLENEFLGGILLPNGQTVAEHLAPQIVDITEHNEMPSLLPGVRELGTGR